PAERGHPGGEVDQHQQAVNRKHELHSVPGQREMRTAIKRVSSEGPHRNFGKHERAVTHPQQDAHQPISFGSKLVVNPEEGELRVKPIQREEEKAFCQGAHLVGVTLLLPKKFYNSALELRNPRAQDPEVSPSVRDETRLASYYPNKSFNPATVPANLYCKLPNLRLNSASWQIALTNQFGPSLI